MLEKQKELLDGLKQDDRNVTAGPLTRLLILGRIDILNWFLTVERGPEDRVSSLDSKVMKMLQKQKDLLAMPIDEKKPNHTSKIAIQGRIEMLEWLMMK